MTIPTGSDGRTHVAVAITNRRQVPITLYLEPWGDEIQVPINKTITIDFKADTVRPIPISYGQDSITVEGWAGTVPEIWCDGQLIG
jgi:hypothetical protein